VRKISEVLSRNKGKKVFFICICTNIINPEKEKTQVPLWELKGINFGMKVGRNKATYYVFDWVGS